MGIRVYFEGQKTLTIKKENFNDVKTALVQLHRSAIGKNNTLLNEGMELRDVFSTFGIDCFIDSDENLSGFAIRGHQDSPPPDISSIGESSWHEHCKIIFETIKPWMDDGEFAWVLGENSLYTKYSYTKDGSQATTLNCEILDKNNKFDVLKLINNYITHALSCGIKIEEIQEKLDDIKVSEVVES